MPPFKDKLTADEIAAVVKYIREDIQAGKSENAKPTKHEH